jgi:hypothetical protein
LSVQILQVGVNFQFKVLLLDKKPEYLFMTEQTSYQNYKQMEPHFKFILVGILSFLLVAPSVCVSTPAVTCCWVQRVQEE